MSFKLDKNGREVLDDTPVAIFIDDLGLPPSMQDIIDRAVELRFQKREMQLNQELETDADILDLDVEYEDDFDDNTKYTKNYQDYNQLKEINNGVNNTSTIYYPSDSSVNTHSSNSVSSDVGTPEISKEKIEEK